MKRLAFALVVALVGATRTAHADGAVDPLAHSFVAFGADMTDVIEGAGGGPGTGAHVQLGEAVTRRVQLVETVALALDNLQSDAFGVRTADLYVTAGVRVVPWLPARACDDACLVDTSALAFELALGVDVRAFDSPADSGGPTGTNRAFAIRAGTSWLAIQTEHWAIGPELRADIALGADSMHRHVALALGLVVVRAL